MSDPRPVNVRVRNDHEADDLSYDLWITEGRLQLPAAFTRTGSHAHRCIMEAIHQIRCAIALVRDASLESIDYTEIAMANEPEGEAP